MRITLHVSSGPGAGRSGQAGPGKPLYVGKGVMAHLRVPDDPDLLNVHFEIECSDAVCRLRDMSGPTGTQVNGQPVRAVELKDGDAIAAGRSTFEVRVAAAAATLPPPPPPPPVVQPTLAAPRPRSVLEALRGQGEPLFALIDAARDRLLPTALLACGERYGCLYDPTDGQDPALVAPHLVELTPEKPFAESLLTAGWGKSWGVFLTCGQPFGEVRAHLRHFLVVQVVGGKPVYFRFYDPRVLRAFLPSCTDEESAAFFGPITAYLMETEQPTALLRAGPRGKSATLPVVPPA